jgi:hypothetical protein|tara:strand:- start:184 stop:561 length:378 start_codon:yes stop_codon:yes gene_type:complete
MPKKSKKSTKASKETVKNLNQAHGRDESKPVPTTLDQIWGDTGLWKYNTNDVDEYSAQVRTMTLADIREHATKNGLVPVGDRSSLEKKLISEFKKHVSKYTVSAVQKREPTSLSEEAKKILKEGQ